MILSNRPEVKLFGMSSQTHGSLTDEQRREMEELTRGDD
jgi:hypothetical protein